MTQRSVWFQFVIEPYDGASCDRLHPQHIVVSAVARLPVQTPSQRQVRSCLDDTKPERDRQAERERARARGERGGREGSREREREQEKEDY